MKCLNCGTEFIKKHTRTNKHHKYCSAKCYWEYHLQDILKKNEKQKE